MVFDRSRGMTNHTRTNNKTNYHYKSLTNHDSNCRKQNAKKGVACNPLRVPLDISASNSQSYPDLVTTNSYYSPQSQGVSPSQSQFSSLSPLSINSRSNSYHSMDHNPSSRFHGYRNYRRYHFTDKQSAKFSLQVFVAMHTTRQLAWYANHEPWGEKNSLLFKYLDYTFRCAAFRDEVYTFDCVHSSHSFPFPHDSDEEDCTEPQPTDDDSSDDDGNRSESRLVFNTGLIARQSGRTVYLILTPNQKKSVAQQWRVGYGDPYNRYNSSFVTDDWLLQHVIPNRNRNVLPKQFKLKRDLFAQIKHKFHKNKLQIEADFDHIVTKYWDRIIAEYNKRSACINVPSKDETTKLLKKAFDAVRRDKKKHELLTPMLYVDSHNTQHSVEYMVPLPINVTMRSNARHRSRHNHRYQTIWFAAALVSRGGNNAQLMSILSADMAYSNARLIGAVSTPWLKKLAPLYHKLESQLAHKISNVLKVYHINQDDDDSVERFLYARFSKYGKILSIDISLISSPNANDLNPSNKFSAAIRFVNSHSVIDAYNGTMDALNRGIKIAYQLDFQLIKEMEPKEAVHTNHLNRGCNTNDGAKSHYLCQFSLIFSRPHILPPPEQVLSNNESGPFYPMHRIQYHECSHCHTKCVDNVPHAINTILSSSSSHHKARSTAKTAEHHPNYRVLYKNESEYNVLSDSLRSYRLNTSYIKCIKRCINAAVGHHGVDKKSVDKKATTETTLWYQTSPNLASQIANHGFIFKFMTDFSKLMDTSGFKFETNPRISNGSIVNEIHLFQCKLRLTDKQLGYLRHNANIIITDTRIIKPTYWIVLRKK